MKKFIALLLLVSACSAHAVTVAINNPGALNVDGTIDWGSLGPSFTTVPNPFVIPVTGVGGLSATVSQAGTSSFERRDQNNGWAGNFGPDEQLLWTAGFNGPMTLSFSSSIQGIGFQIQQNQFGLFTATLEAFDSANVSLGLFLFNGNSTFDGDDSAIFIGALSDTADIARIVVNVDTFDFAINGPLIQSGGGQVPEGGATVVLLLMGCAAVFALRKRIGSASPRTAPGQT